MTFAPALSAVPLSTAIAQAQRLLERGEAAQCIEQIAVVWPLLGEDKKQCADLGLMQVQALCRLKLWQRASVVLHRLIRLDPAQRIYWYNLVICLAEQQGQTATDPPPQADGERYAWWAQLNAAARMTLALSRQLPQDDQAQAWQQLCSMLQRYGLGEVLQQAAQTWHTLCPQQLEPEAFGAMALHALGQYDAALQVWQRLEQNSPQVMAQQRDWQMFAAQASLELQHYTDALQRYQIVLQQEPGHSEALHNLAVVQSLLGQRAASRASTERALQLQPEAAAVRFKWSLHLLREGQYAPGFAMYEARLETEKPGSPLYERTLGLRDRGFPLWRGEPLQGKRLFVQPEQGHGDFLMMVRFLPRCLDAGASEIRYFMTGNLERYARALPLDVRIIYQPVAHAHEIDIYTPLMSLPACLHIARPEQCGPPLLPLLAPQFDAAQLKQQQNAVAAFAQGAACWGFTWRGSDQHPNTRWRNIPLADFLQQLIRPLQTRGVRCVSLQKDATLAERAQLRAAGVECAGIATCKDWYDTAHLMQALDGLVAVDTALVHLAGTLAKPVLMLNRHEAIGDWRWLHDQTLSPWYPSLHILTQSHIGQWDNVLAAALEHAIWQTQELRV